MTATDEVSHPAPAARPAQVGRWYWVAIGALPLALLLISAVLVLIAARR